MIAAPYQVPFTDGNGRITEAWLRWIGGVTSGANAGQLAATTADAVHTSRVVGAGPGLVGGGDLTDNRTISLYRAIDIVANLPATGNSLAQWCFATNARNSGEGAGAGTGSPVCWSGTAWRIPGVASAVTA